MGGKRIEKNEKKRYKKKKKERKIKKEKIEVASKNQAHLVGRQSGGKDLGEKRWHHDPPADGTNTQLHILSREM